MPDRYRYFSITRSEALILSDYAYSSDAAVLILRQDTQNDGALSVRPADSNREAPWFRVSGDVPRAKRTTTS